MASYGNGNLNPDGNIDFRNFKFGTDSEDYELDCISENFEKQYTFSDDYDNIITVNAKKYKIEQVSVYLSFAEVRKTIKKVRIVPGINKVIIEHLPPVIIVDKFRWVQSLYIINTSKGVSILDTNIKVVPLDILKSINGSGPIDLSDDTYQDGIENDLNEKLRQAEIGLVMLERKQRMLDATFIPSAETGGEKSFCGNPAFVLTAMQQESATEQFERILKYYADMSADIDQKITKQNKLINKLNNLVKEFDGNHNCSYFVRNNCTVVSFLINSRIIDTIDIGLVYGNVT
ncbi:hypothetical protein AYI69_g1745 [Smittium culicis]|uniref:Uncharacterized protein n=1 Tax=Smittium culicis TaxID=133412 RepID=A0A1R1YPE4_9FUNG|nr:hypothetical protein AYI69_g1745 [Smittium culicis]